MQKFDINITMCTAVGHISMLCVKMSTRCITTLDTVIPRLPIEELMKVNFRRLTTSHHGDL